MNQKKNKRIFILGFFILIWISLIFYGYKRYQELHKQSERLVILNEHFKISENKDFKECFFSRDELFAQIDESGKSQCDCFFGKIANAQDKDLLDEEEEVQDINKIDESSFFDEEEIVSEIEMCGEFQCYTGEQFIDIYSEFERNLGLFKVKKQIYNNEEIDSYIRDFAELRGYKERVFADNEDIIDYMYIKTRIEVKDSYIAMRNEMKNYDIFLHFVSGYRDANHQREIFKRKIGEIETLNILSGIYDKRIKDVLIRSALPGYSKHHSGYAVDFGCGSDYLVYSFFSTECYDWMSKNNFENSKRFGFIPSYPNDVENQGPDPEPWEFVWVGVENIK